MPVFRQDQGYAHCSFSRAVPPAFDSNALRSDLGDSMLTFFSRYWWVLVVRGAIGILFGVLAFMLPTVAVAALVLAFGAYVLADGIFALSAALGGRALSDRWWVVLLHGIIGIGVGLLTLFNPAITAVALLLYVAAWAIVAGVLQIYAAIRLRRELVGEWWLVLGGVLGVAFGIAMLWNPGAGALALLWLIAAYAILWGAMLIVGGFELRRATRPITPA